MPKLTFKVRNLDPQFRTMARVERDLMRDVGFGVDEAAQALATYIKGSWSLNSPSSVGSPPAIVTGNLDSSVMVEKTGRDERGRFASPENTYVKFVRIDTSQGMNPGERGNYAHILEGKLDRPFIEPAIEVVGQLYGAIMKRVITI